MKKTTIRIANNELINNPPRLIISEVVILMA